MNDCPIHVYVPKPGVYCIKLSRGGGRYKNGMATLIKSVKFRRAITVYVTISYINSAVVCACACLCVCVSVLVCVREHVV